MLSLYRIHREIRSGHAHDFIHVKNHHVHLTTWNFVHWLPRYASTITYFCIALLQLLYRQQHQSRKLWIHPRIVTVFREIYYWPAPIPEAGRLLFVIFLWLFIYYIYSYLLWFEAVSNFHFPKMWFEVVIGTHVTWILKCYKEFVMQVALKASFPEICLRFKRNLLSTVFAKKTTWSVGRQR
jgi:hypothetical protein